MVLQRRSSMKGKQQTPAKPKTRRAAAEEDDMDMFFNSEDDSESEQQIKRTPAGKGLKGKQPQSDKRVSFQIPGRNTPATKTPKGENTIVGKKQLTPGKQTALKEFHGILSNSSAKKNGKTTKMPVQDDDDEDDDEEDDIDMLLGGDDDDDNDEDVDDEDEEDDNEEEEDEDDDDEDDDDEDEEIVEKEKPKKQLNKTKQTTLDDKKSKVAEKNTSKTPDKSLKTAEKQAIKGAQKAIIPTKVASPEKVKKADDKPFTGNSKAMRFDEEIRRNRDAKTLFVGNLPLDITAAELQALSNDILHVSIPGLLKKGQTRVVAYLEFLNESKAEENYDLLSSKKLRGQPIKLDYTGIKSRKKSDHPNEQNVDLKKLFVSSLPLDVTLNKVAHFFPKGNQLFLSTGSTDRTAYVNFASEEDAADALKACKDAEIDGKPITVLYCNSRDNKKRKRKHMRKPKTTHQGGKKMKHKKSKMMTMMNK